VVDRLRGKEVAATPEELVRQRLLAVMIHQLGFPKELIAIEKQLSELPHLQRVASLPDRRADIICFAKNIHSGYPLYPLLLIECKEGEAGGEAIAQAMGYNHFVQAPYVAVAGRGGTQLVHPQRLPFLPSYAQLLEKYEMCLRSP
jgi:hypothetical protein